MTRYSEPKFDIGQKVWVIDVANESMRGPDVFVLSRVFEYGGWIYALTEDGKRCCGTISEGGLRKI